MNNKKCAFFIIGVFVLFCMGAQAETKKLRNIGQYKLVNIQKDMTSGEIFQSLLDKFSADIQNGFNLAGYSNLSVPFIDQVKQSAYTEKELAVGDKIVWMLSAREARSKSSMIWNGRGIIPYLSIPLPS